MSIPLEDNVGDIIGKAQRGLGISDSELAERARVHSDEIRKLRGRHFEEMTLWRIAPILELAPRALVELSRNEWTPTPRHLDGLAMFTTPFDDITVNAFLLWDKDSRDAVAFDTGAKCAEMLRTITDKKLTVRLILLTHTHHDHIADLPELRRATNAPVYVSKREPTSGAETIDEGQTFKVGHLKIEARLTWGHSRGGMTYYVTGLTSPVAIVGDSLFAGSMGGGAVSYPDAVRNNLEKILTLPEKTILCPGHGPLTTVGEEKAHNPFFAAKFGE